MSKSKIHTRLPANAMIPARLIAMNVFPSPDTDDVIPHLDHIGYNGTWELDFEVPTYIWLLENL
jgi:hypothetical protein